MSTEPCLQIIRRIRRFIAIKPGRIIVVDQEHRLDLTPDAADALELKEEAMLARRMRDDNAG